jgi:DNA-binding IclR family transcriptional regulator
MAGNSADSGRSVTNKIIAILLTFSNGNAYSLTEIARLSGLPISTAHRLATELAAWGILERTDDGQYRVGLQLKVICSHPGHASGMHERARRVMEDLAAATRATARLGVLEGLDVTFIEKRANSQPVSTFLGATTVPSYATAMGKALLAFSSPRVTDMVVARGLKRYTPFTVTSPDRLRRSLAVCRLTRVAVARRELYPDASAVAVPVFGAGGGVVAALELEIGDPLGDLRVVQPAVFVAARSLSRDLATSHSNGQSLLTGGERRSYPHAAPAHARGVDDRAYAPRAGARIPNRVNGT